MKRTSGIWVQDQLININWRGLGKDKASLRGTNESVLHRTVNEVPLKVTQYLSMHRQFMHEKHIRPYQYLL